MQDKTILITGAGFSSPANLPIQSRILDEMITEQDDEFLNISVEAENVAFLDAYINVALYLLKEYSHCDTSGFEKEYIKLKEAYNSNEYVQEAIIYMQEIIRVSGGDISSYSSMASDKLIIDFDKYRYSLYEIKEKLRQQLKENNIKVCLEDIFTSFDKSLALRENTSNYTYTQLDYLQHSILRLFVYYFSKKVNSHNCDLVCYQNVMNSIKNHNMIDTVITTNWDVLLEKYFEKNNCDYKYAFDSPYVLDCSGEIYEKAKNSGTQKISYIKMHGSINWFKCLKCGTIRVATIDSCGEMVFHQTPDVVCPRCGCAETISNIAVKPEIITPTMIKTINNQLYNNIWKNAEYALQNAKKIIFCGYSLPVADFEFRYLLKRNIRPNTEIDVVLYKNDNPLNYHEDVRVYLPEQRYRELLSNCKCNFYYEGFGDYFFNQR